MKKCIVITRFTPHDLEQSANKMLNNGWIPLGGVAIEKESENVFAYCLTMMHENYEVDLSEEQPRKEKAILPYRDIISGLVNLIDDASDEHGDLGQAFTPEYQTVYKRACKLLNRDPHEMLV